MAERSPSSKACILLQLNLTKIEQLGSGAVYCQVIDVIHSGSVAMNKVNWKAKSDYEFTQNLRILQDAFKKIGIKRYVEVDLGLYLGGKIGEG